MAFVKLDTGILDSTLWIERDQREVFITALLMAEPHEFHEPIKQIEVGQIKFTGFEVPAGWYGFVRAAGIGIVNRAGVERKKGMAALRKLGEPENESRSPEFEGRRMIRTNDGYVILNYMKFRDKDHTAAERQRRLRERRRAEIITRDVHEVTRDETLPSRNITQADADADANTERRRGKNRAPARAETTEAEQTAMLEALRPLGGADAKVPGQIKAGCVAAKPGQPFDLKRALDAMRISLLKVNSKIENPLGFVIDQTPTVYVAPGYKHRLAREKQQQTEQAEHETARAEQTKDREYDLWRREQSEMEARRRFTGPALREAASAAYHRRLIGPDGKELAEKYKRCSAKAKAEIEFSALCVEIRQEQGFAAREDYERNLTQAADLREEGSGSAQ
jgi:hypothetical protein